MTQNQVAYWNYKEVQRHNLQDEGIRSGTLHESVRHNVQTETLGYLNLDESKRHNVQEETIGFQSNRIKSVANDLNAINFQWQHQDRQSANSIAYTNAQWQHDDRRATNDIAFFNYKVSSQQLGINQQNADTAAQTATIAAQRNEWEHNDRIWSNVNGSVNALSNVVGTAVKVAPFFGLA